MSALSPLLAVERKSDLRAVKSAFETRSGHCSAALALIRVPRSRLFLGIRICIDEKRVSSNLGSLSGMEIGFACSYYF
jgi:hypothetical protein